MVDRRVVGVAAALVIVVLSAYASSASGRRSPSARAGGAGLVGLPTCGAGTTRGAIPGWRLGAVQFFSSTSGIGITAGRFPCFTHSSAGTETRLRSQPVNVAVTHDGGRWWSLVGAPAPVGSTAAGEVTEQILASSSSDLWVLAGNGRVLATHDGGQDWEASTIPGPAVEIAKGPGYVWALSCPPTSTRSSPSACRPELWRAAIGGLTWSRAALPEVTAQASEFVDLAISPDGDMLINVFTAGRTVIGEQLISTDRGGHWRTRTDPTWDRQRCTFGGLLAAAAPHTFWLLCIGGAAAGSSAKGLLRSTDAGTTWSVVSASPSLTKPPPPGAITLEEPSALTAGSPKRLWLSLVNGLSESDDGGRTWSNQSPAVINPQGWPTVIAVLGARDAWVLAPGAGLWRTTDGQDWHAVGPLNTT